VSRRDFLCLTGFGTAATAAEVQIPAAAAATPPVVRTPGVREYWVVARPRRWNVSPTGLDDWSGRRMREMRFRR
jgi:hypothetical protein